MLNLLRGPDFNVACSLACSFKQTEGVAHEEDFRSTVSGRPGIPLVGYFDDLVGLLEAKEMPKRAA
jgi:hypothetical protein